MSQLLTRHAPSSSIRQAHTLLMGSDRRKNEVVEISSDDDSEAPSPPRRPTIVTKKTRESSSSDSDMDSSSDSDVSLSPVPQRRAHHHKRPKLEHTPGPEAALPQSRCPTTTMNVDHAQRFDPYKARLYSPPRIKKRTSKELAFVGQRHELTVRPAAMREELHLKPTSRLAASSNASPLAVHLAKTAPEKAMKAEKPPYYQDTKLEARMYRGAGYERFPVVLGTVQGHQKISDRWDAKLASRNRRRQERLRRSNLHGSLQAILVESNSDFDESEDESPPQPTRSEMQHLLAVMEVFPDIQQDFVMQKIRSQRDQLNLAQDDEIQEQPTAADLVSQILEMEDYPKEKLRVTGKTTPVPLVDETGITISWDRNLLKNPAYLKDAVILLAGQFDHVPTHYIHKVVHDKRSVFEAYLQIHDIDNNYYGTLSRPYSRPRQPRLTLEKKYSARTAHEQRDRDQYSSMVNELQAAKQHLAREALKLTKQKANEEAEAANLATHKAAGSLIECQCCFDDEVPINRSVTCEGESIHFFCFACVVQLAETQVGSMKHEMLCMDGSGCKAALSLEGVGQAVSIKTFDRLAFNQQQAEIAAAGIEGLEQCPFCDFKAICEPVEFDSVFNCQNPDCGRATCRKCKEDTHLPKTCEEYKADRGLSARHLVEEARSAAAMRPCPKCKVKIIKELGCNKMRCTTCGCVMCYVCKADISSGKEGGYEHFNKTGAKCKLYDDAGVDRHEIEADEAEKEAIRKAKAANAGLDEKDLQIETGAGQKKQKKTIPPVPADRDPVRQAHRELMGHHQADMARVQQLQAQMQRQQREMGARVEGANANYGARLAANVQAEMAKQNAQRIGEWQAQLAAPPAPQANVGFQMVGATALAGAAMPGGWAQGPYQMFNHDPFQAQRHVVDQHHDLVFYQALMDGGRIHAARQAQAAAAHAAQRAQQQAAQLAVYQARQMAPQVAPQAPQAQHAAPQTCGGQVNAAAGQPAPGQQFYYSSEDEHEDYYEL